MYSQEAPETSSENSYAYIQAHGDDSTVRADLSEQPPAVGRQSRSLSVSLVQ